jgi:hypothetical protein
MEKIMLTTISLPYGRVINVKEISLASFSVNEVIEYGERCDYGSFNADRLDMVLNIPTPQHRSVEQVNEHLIVRYMDTYPQYFYKK